MRASIPLSEALRIDSQGRLIACTVWEGDSTEIVHTGVKEDQNGEPVFLCNEICLTKVRKEDTI